MKNNELTAVKAEMPSLEGLPQEVIDYVLGLVAENLALRVAVDGVNSELYGKGFEVLGWHLNGDTEPLDTWFEDNDWDPETPLTDAAIAEVKLPLAAEVDAYKAFVDNLGVIHSLKAPETDHLLAYYEARGSEKMFNLVEPAVRNFCNPAVTELVIEELESLAANLRAGRKG